MLRPRSEARRSCSGAALPRRWETPAAPNGESVGGGEEGDVDVGEVVDEPQSETAASGTARGAADEAGERVGWSGADVMHTDHDPVDARPLGHAGLTGVGWNRGSHRRRLEPAAITAAGWNRGGPAPPNDDGSG
jgi:hypothetical protein